MALSSCYQVGSRILVEQREEAVLARVHGAESCRWNSRMGKQIGKFGCVARITGNDHLRLKFYEAEIAEHARMKNAVRWEGVAEVRWTFTPVAVAPAPRVFFAEGDRVVICPDEPYVLEAHAGLHSEGVHQNVGRLATVVSVAHKQVVVVRVDGCNGLVDVLNACLLPVYGVDGEGVLRAVCADGRDHVDASSERLIFGLPRSIVAADVAAFHEASRAGDEDGLSLFLHRHSEHVDDTLADSDGRTALMLACENGQRSVAQILLMIGACPQRTDASGLTALHRAVAAKQMAMAQMLLDWAPDLLNVRNGKGETALHLAVAVNEPTLTKKLLSQDAVEVNAQDCFGNTPLHKALSLTDARVLEVLLENGRVDVGTPNNLGFNALHYASVIGDMRYVRVLLNRSAELLAVPKSDGYLPLHLAALNGHALVVEDLLQRDDCNVDADVNDGKTALHLAAMFAKDGSKAADEQRLRAAFCLLDAGAAVDAKDGDGDTALHLAMKAMRAACERRRQPPAADVIVALQTMDANEPSCGAIADKCGDWPELSLVCFLLSRGAALDAQNADGCTPAQLLDERRLELVWKHFAVARADLAGASESADNEAETVAMCTMNHCQGENVADVLYVPCGHRLLCTKCVRLVAVRRCQKCGVGVEGLRDLQGREVEAACELRRLRAQCEQLQAANSALATEFDRAVLCQICMDRRTSVAFGCGHVACQACSRADVLTACHACREPITKRQDIFANWKA